MVDAGGFTAAARALGLTPGAVSRRVRTLERRLGTRLLNRTTRRVSLTEAGATYHRQVARTLEDLRQVEARLSHLADEPVGHLRVSAPTSFGIRRLARLGAVFAARHPSLQFDLQLDDRFTDIVGEGYDLALRIGRLADSRLVARALVPVHRVVCAAPSYLDVHGRPERPADLAGHACLHYSHLTLREEWTLTGDGEPEAVDVTGPVRSNNGEVLREAALAGLGIVLLPGFIVEEDLRTGRLERVLAAFRPTPFTLYGVYPSREYVPRKVHLFLDFLRGALSGTGSA